MVAKGALKEGSVQGMHIDQGNVVRFEPVEGRGMPIMTGAYAIHVFAGIRANVRRQAAAWSLLETVSMLVTAPEEDASLWRALLAGLHRLNACDPEDALMVLRNVQRDVLSILGYMPQVHSCGVCGSSSTDGQASFSIELGSVICSRCTRSGWYGMALGDTDRQWLANERSSAPCASRAVRAPTERLIEYISGKPLLSLNLLFEAMQT